MTRLENKMHNNPTFLGTVQDVQGATISIMLDKDTVSGLVFINGYGYRIGQPGSFVRISIGFIDLYGIVSQVGAGAVPKSLAGAEPYGHRWMRVQLVGESLRQGEFKRGISQYPTIGDEAHLVTDQDLSRIYGFEERLKYVRIGGLASAESIPALIDIDRLANRHSAVLGTTGAGKSTTVSSILHSLSDSNRFPSSRILVLDIHGEYHSALSDRSVVFRVNAKEERGEQQLFVPYWALSFDELMRVTPFRGLSDSDRSALLDKVKHLKHQSILAFKRQGVDEDTLTVDTPYSF